jgi:hypothetical protein
MSRMWLSPSVLALLDGERRTLFMRGVQGELLPELTRVHGTDADWHQIAFSALSEQNADRVIAEQVAHYQALARRVEWTVYAHDGPADLLQRLERQGFSIGPREAVMVLDTARRPAWVDAPPTHHVVAIDDAQQLRLYAALAREIHGDDRSPLIRELEARLAERSREHVAYLAFDHGVPASIGRLYTDPRSAFGGLYGGSTLEAHRGRGLYRATLARRVADALRDGARYVRVDALPTSQPILKRLGFEELTQAWPCTLDPR